MHVHAVNQQFPDIKGAAAFLILTKFAELLPKDSPDFVWAVTMKELEAITRLSKSTLRRNLKQLADCGALVPLDDPKLQHEIDDIF